MSDYHICTQCNGEGSIPHETDNDLAKQCSKCQGEGLLDWIENII